MPVTGWWELVNDAFLSIGSAIPMEKITLNHGRKASLFFVFQYVSQANMASAPWDSALI
jgi:hypothetical protein